MTRSYFAAMILYYWIIILFNMDVIFMKKYTWNIKYFYAINIKVELILQYPNQATVFKNHINTN